MGKLRNHGGDVGLGLVQFIGRKIRHHDPLAEIDDHVLMRGAKLRVGVVKNEPLQIVYLLGNGQRYEITVREVEPDEEVKKLVPVGQ